MSRQGKLQQLIDNQDVEQLNEFLIDNADMNFNCITPNGASALWLALMSKPGQQISYEVVRCLLETRHDGRRLVSPVQELGGLYPLEYLRSIDNIDQSIIELVKRAYDAYIQVSPNNDEQPNSTRFAKDGQNVYGSAMSEASPSNIINSFPRLAKFVQKGLPDKDKSFARDICYLTLFDSKQDSFIKQNPQQEAWLKHLNLSKEDIIELIGHVDARQEEQIGSADFDLISHMVIEAVNHGKTEHLTLADMTFYQQDFRGCDFSGVDLTNVHFDNCILPFAGSPSSCEGVTFTNSYCANMDNQNNTIALANILSSQDVNSRSTLMMHLFLQQIESKEDLIEKCNRPEISLHRKLARQGDTENLKALLASEHCSPELLATQNESGVTALIFAAENGHAGCVKAILDSQHCTSEVFTAINKFESNALMFAASGGHTGCVEAILESQHCTSEVITNKNHFRNDAYMEAMRNKNGGGCAGAILSASQTIFDRQATFNSQTGFESYVRRTSGPSAASLSLFSTKQELNNGANSPSNQEGVTGNP